MKQLSHIVLPLLLCTALVHAARLPLQISTGDYNERSGKVTRRGSVTVDNLVQLAKEAINSLPGKTFNNAKRREAGNWIRVFVLGYQGGNETYKQAAERLIDWASSESRGLPIMRSSVIPNWEAALQEAFEGRAGVIISDAAETSDEDLTAPIVPFVTGAPTPSTGGPGAPATGMPTTPTGRPTKRVRFKEEPEIIPSKEIEPEAGKEKAKEIQRKLSSGMTRQEKLAFLKDMLLADERAQKELQRAIAAGELDDALLDKIMRDWQEALARGTDLETLKKQWTTFFFTPYTETQAHAVLDDIKPEKLSKAEKVNILESFIANLDARLNFEKAVKAMTDAEIDRLFNQVHSDLQKKDFAVVVRELTERFALRSIGLQPGPQPGSSGAVGAPKGLGEKEPEEKPAKRAGAEELEKAAKEGKGAAAELQAKIKDTVDNFSTIMVMNSRAFRTRKDGVPAEQMLESIEGTRREIAALGLPTLIDQARKAGLLEDVAMLEFALNDSDKKLTAQAEQLAKEISGMAPAFVSTKKPEAPEKGKSAEAKAKADASSASAATPAPAPSASTPAPAAPASVSAAPASSAAAPAVSASSGVSAGESKRKEAEAKADVASEFDRRNKELLAEVQRIKKMPTISDEDKTDQGNDIVTTLNSFLTLAQQVDASTIANKRELLINIRDNAQQLPGPKSVFDDPQFIYRSDNYVELQEQIIGLADKYI